MKNELFLSHEEGKVVDEAAFFQKLVPYQKQAKNKRLYMQFHVFADAKDTFPKTAEEALAVYQQLLNEGYPAVRLYIELYEDYENDVLFLEDALLGYGGYPW